MDHQNYRHVQRQQYLMDKIAFRSRESCVVSSTGGDVLLCLICQDVCAVPLKCTKCRAIFCQICTIKWRQNSTQCPNRCSPEWKLQKIDVIDPELVCPYNAQCGNLSTSKFQDHLLTCEHAPFQIKEQYRLRQEYRCVNNHKLVFSCDRFTSLYSTKCFECQESKYCKNECLTCKHFYCGKCRLPPLTKKWCPGGQHMYINKTPHPGFTCEKCQLQPLLLGKRCYDDMSCNFGLCESCHDGLPELTVSKSITIGSSDFKAQWFDDQYWQALKISESSC